MSVHTDLVRYRFSAARRAIVAATILLTALLGLTGCNDTPSPVGSEYLPQNVVFKTVTLRPSDFNIVSGIANVANSTSQAASGMLVGAADDGSVANSLMAVTGATNLTLGHTLTGVSLRLRTYGYSYGATASKITSFDVVELGETSIDNLKWSDGLAASIAAAPVVGTYTGTYADTAFITVPLDLSAAKSFLGSYYRYDTTFSSANGKPDTIVSLVTLKTLALRPHSDAHTIVSFIGATVALSDSLHPSLHLVFSDTTADLKIGATNWIAKVPSPFGAGKIVAAGGVPLRTLMRLNLDSIPATATILQAKLTLHVDTALSHVGTTGVTKVATAYIGTSTSSLTGTMFIGSGTVGPYPGFRAAADSTTFTNTFTFTLLAPAITSWQQNRRSGDKGIANNGIIIGINRNSASGADYETGTVDQLVFHDFSASDSTLWPSMSIIYSVQADVK